MTKKSFKRRVWYLYCKYCNWYSILFYPITQSSRNHAWSSKSQIRPLTSAIYLKWVIQSVSKCWKGERHGALLAFVLNKYKFSLPLPSRYVPKYATATGPRRGRATVGPRPSRHGRCHGSLTADAWNPLLMYLFFFFPRPFRHRFRFHLVVFVLFFSFALVSLNV